MTERCRLLVDVRQDANLRGFHVLASLYLIADRLRSVELYRLGGDELNENIACRAFSFDTGLEFRRIWRLILIDSNSISVSPPPTTFRETPRPSRRVGPPDAQSLLSCSAKMKRTRPSMPSSRMGMTLSIWHRPSSMNFCSMRRRRNHERQRRPLERTPAYLDRWDA